MGLPILAPARAAMRGVAHGARAAMRCISVAARRAQQPNAPWTWAVAYGLVKLATWTVRAAQRPLPLRAAKIASQQLWLLNLATNSAAAVWSYQFWRQTSAIELTRVLPLHGDQAGTIRTVCLPRWATIGDGLTCTIRALTV